MPPSRGDGQESTSPPNDAVIRSDTRRDQSVYETAASVPPSATSRASVISNSRESTPRSRLKIPVQISRSSPVIRRSFTRPSIPDFTSLQSQSDEANTSDPIDLSTNANSASNLQSPPRHIVRNRDTPLSLQGVRSFPGRKTSPLGNSSSSSKRLRQPRKISSEFGRLQAMTAVMERPPDSSSQHVMESLSSPFVEQSRTPHIPTPIPGSPKSSSASGSQDVSLGSDSPTYRSSPLKLDHPRPTPQSTSTSSLIALFEKAAAKNATSGTKGSDRGSQSGGGTVTVTTGSIASSSTHELPPKQPSISPLNIRKTSSLTSTPRTSVRGGSPLKQNITPFYDGDGGDDDDNGDSDDNDDKDGNGTDDNGNGDGDEKDSSDPDDSPDGSDNDERMIIAKQGYVYYQDSNDTWMKCYAIAYRYPPSDSGTLLEHSMPALYLYPNEDSISHFLVIDIGHVTSAQAIRSPPSTAVSTSTESVRTGYSSEGIPSRYPFDLTTDEIVYHLASDSPIERVRWLSTIRALMEYSPRVERLLEEARDRQRNMLAEQVLQTHLARQQGIPSPSSSPRRTRLLMGPSSNRVDSSATVASQFIDESDPGISDAAVEHEEPVPTQTTETGSISPYYRRRRSLSEILRANRASHSSSPGPRQASTSPMKTPEEFKTLPAVETAPSQDSQELKPSTTSISAILDLQTVNSRLRSTHSDLHHLHATQVSLINDLRTEMRSQLRSTIENGRALRGILERVIVPRLEDIFELGEGMGRVLVSHQPRGSTEYGTTAYDTSGLTTQESTAPGTLVRRQSRRKRRFSWHCNAEVDDGISEVEVRPEEYSKEVNEHIEDRDEAIAALKQMLADVVLTPSNSQVHKRKHPIKQQDKEDEGEVERVATMQTMKPLSDNALSDETFRPRTSRGRQVDSLLRKRSYSVGDTGRFKSRYINLTSWSDFTREQTSGEEVKQGDFPERHESQENIRSIDDADPVLSRETKTEPTLSGDAVETSDVNHIIHNTISEFANRLPTSEERMIMEDKIDRMLNLTTWVFENQQRLSELLEGAGSGSRGLRNRGRDRTVNVPQSGLGSTPGTGINLSNEQNLEDIVRRVLNIAESERADGTRASIRELHDEVDIDNELNPPPSKSHSRYTTITTTRSSKIRARGLAAAAAGASDEVDRFNGVSTVSGTKASSRPFSAQLRDMSTPERFEPDVDVFGRARSRRQRSQTMREMRNVSELLSAEDEEEVLTRASSVRSHSLERLEDRRGGSNAGSYTEASSTIAERIRQLRMSRATQDRIQRGPVQVFRRDSIILRRDARAYPGPILPTTRGDLTIEQQLEIRDSAGTLIDNVRLQNIGQLGRDNALLPSRGMSSEAALLSSSGVSTTYSEYANTLPSRTPSLPSERLSTILTSRSALGTSVAQSIRLLDVMSDGSSYIQSDINNYSEADSTTTITPSMYSNLGESASQRGRPDPTPPVLTTMPKTPMPNVPSTINEIPEPERLSGSLPSVPLPSVLPSGPRSRPRSVENDFLRQLWEALLGIDSRIQMSDDGLKNVANLLNAGRDADVALNKQNQEVVKYLHGLNEWLEKDYSDRVREGQNTAENMNALRNQLGSVTRDLENSLRQAMERMEQMLSGGFMYEIPDNQAPIPQTGIPHPGLPQPTMPQTGMPAPLPPQPGEAFYDQREDPGGPVPPGGPMPPIGPGGYSMYGPYMGPPGMMPPGMMPPGMPPPGMPPGIPHGMPPGPWYMPPDPYHPGRVWPPKSRFDRRGHSSMDEDHDHHHHDGGNSNGTTRIVFENPNQQATVNGLPGAAPSNAEPEHTLGNMSTTQQPASAPQPDDKKKSRLSGLGEFAKEVGAAVVGNEIADLARHAFEKGKDKVKGESASTEKKETELGNVASDGKVAAAAPSTGSHPAAAAPSTVSHPVVTEADAGDGGVPVQSGPKRTIGSFFPKVTAIPPSAPSADENSVGAGGHVQTEGDSIGGDGKGKGSNTKSSGGSSKKEDDVTYGNMAGDKDSKKLKKKKEAIEEDAGDDDSEEQQKHTAKPASKSSAKAADGENVKKEKEASGGDAAGETAKAEAAKPSEKSVKSKTEKPPNGPTKVEEKETEIVKPPSKVEKNAGKSEENKGDEKKEEEKKGEDKQDAKKEEAKKGEAKKGEDKKGEDKKGEDKKGEDKKGEDKKGEDKKDDKKSEGKKDEKKEGSGTDTKAKDAGKKEEPKKPPLPLEDPKKQEDLLKTQQADHKIIEEMAKQLTEMGKMMKHLHEKHDHLNARQDYFSDKQTHLEKVHAGQYTDLGKANEKHYNSHNDLLKKQSKAIEDHHKALDKQKQDYAKAFNDAAKAHTEPLKKEIEKLTKEVGELREQKRALQYEIGELLLLKAGVKQENLKKAAPLLKPAPAQENKPKEEKKDDKKGEKKEEKKDDKKDEKKEGEKKDDKKKDEKPKTDGPLGPRPLIQINVPN